MRRVHTSEVRQRLASALAGARSLPAVLEAASEILGAVGAGLWTAAHASAPPHLRASRGLAPPTQALFDAPGAPELAAAIAAGEPIWSAPAPEHGGGSLACVPLSPRPPPHGALVVVFPESKPRDEAEIELVRLVAQHAAMRIAPGGARDHAALLAEVGGILVLPGELAPALESVGRALTRWFATQCRIEVSAGESLRMSIRIGEEAAASARELTLTLVASGRLLGAYTLARPPSDSFDAADRAHAEAIAHALALAIDRARLELIAAEASSVRDDFLSVAAHELKTPLTTVMIQLATLQRLFADLPGEIALRARPKLASLERQIDRLTALARRLLDAHQIRGGRLDLEREEADLGEIASDVVHRLRDLAEGGEAAISIHHPGPVRGRWDRERIDQAITQLVANTLEHAQRSPIEITVRSEGELAELEVRDRGEGIAPQDHARIFEPFGRAGARSRVGGLGLGLWIAREIVERHGGTLSVDSGPGAGATFRVRLPRG